jgi:capsular exopolysaccharide synthesis family protein
MKTSQRRGAGETVSHDRGFQEYLAVVLRGKWIITVTFLVILLVTLLVTKLADPVYQATCQVLLNPAELRSTIFVDASRSDGVKNIIQNELAILNSRALMDSVGERLRRKKFLDEAQTEYIPMVHALAQSGKNDEVASLPVVSGNVASAVDFDPVRDSDIIRITAKSMNPREAALVANTFAEAYRDRNIYMSRAKSRSFREFLEAQALEKRKSLEETEGSLQSYMEKQGVVSLDDEARRMIDQLAQLEASRDATEILLKEVENTLASYQAQLPQQETNLAKVVGEASDSYIRQMQEQLSRLEVQRDMTVVQNPSTAGREILNEKVKEIDQQIASLRLKLQRRTDDFLRTLTAGQGEGTDAAGYLKSVKQKILEQGIEVSSLMTKKQALNEAIAEYERKFDRIPEKSIALARLQRARMSNEKLYLMVEERYNEANITEQSNIGYIEFVERASVPSKPSSPKPLINFSLGAVVGLMLGIALAFVREVFDVRVQTPEELKRHGFTPLTPIVNMDQEIHLLGRGQVTAKNQAVDDHLITLLYPFSAVAESYRQMRTNLQFAKFGTPVRTILVTSPGAGEGKSTTVSNLAIAFAQTGKRVLLIDADLRRPTLSLKFKVKAQPGLAECVSGAAPFAKVVQSTTVENLYVMVSGDIPSNPSEVLGSDAMRDLMLEAGKKYDVVLFDSSPILAVTDPAVISTMVDGTIIVIASGKTRLQDLEQAAELLHGVGGRMLGVVMNNFDASKAYGIISRRGGRYRYSYRVKDERATSTPPDAETLLQGQKGHGT